MKVFLYTGIVLFLVAARLSADQPNFLCTPTIWESDIQYVVDAELTPSGDVVILGWEDDFKFYVAQYTIEGERCWKLDCPSFRGFYCIPPITSSSDEIIVQGHGKDRLQNTHFLKISPEGKILDELAFSYDSGYGFAKGMKIDSLDMDCVAGFFMGETKSTRPTFKCIDWNYTPCWSYDYPDIRSRNLNDDVTLLGSDKIVLADLWCYDEADKAVRCPEGIRSWLSFTIVDMDTREENTRTYELDLSLCITKLFRVSDGYLLTGYPRPQGIHFDNAPVFLIKFNSHGDTLWSGIYPRESDTAEHVGPLDLIETDDGRYLLLLEHRGAAGGSTGFLMVEISDKGKQMSVEHYGGGKLSPRRMLRLSDQEILIVGDKQMYARHTRTFLMYLRY